MRYYEILNEKIVTRPRNLERYLTLKVQALNGLLTELRQAQSLINDNLDGESMLRYFLRYGSDDDDASSDIDSLAWFARDGYNDGEARLERYLPLTRLKENMEAYLRHGAQLWPSILNTFKYTEEISDRVRAVMAILPTAEAGAVQYGYDDTSEKDEEYHQAMNLLRGLRLIADVVTKGEALIADVKERLGAVADRLAHGDRYRPEHAEVETLYHATVFATEVARDGFQAEKPLGRQGVGNFGTQDNISFTHDLKIAQDIMRAFKDIWYIAHGQLTARHIMGWLKAEGIDVKDPKFVQTVGIGEKVPVQYGDYHTERYRTKEIHELSTPEEALKLYNVYLWFSKIRTNPVFSGMEKLLDIMKTRTIKDIGIVSCEVQLGKGDEYMQGEAEFRVSAHQVQSIKRIM